MINIRSFLFATWFFKSFNLLFLDFLVLFALINDIKDEFKRFSGEFSWNRSSGYFDEVTK